MSAETASSPTLVVAAEWRARPCPLCDTQQAPHALGSRRHLCQAQSASFEFLLHDVVCTDCGFVFASRIPDAEFLEAYYRGGFTYESAFETIAPDYDERQRLETVRAVIPPGARVLEIGAGTGEFLSTLNGAGYHADGIDPLVAPGDRGVAPGFVGEQWQDRQGTHDAIVSYYVLEHVADPGPWLRRVSARLEPGGWLVLEVPDYERFALESLYPEHFSHFTARHLAALLRRHGFEPVLTETAASRYFGFVMVARRARGPSNQSFPTGGVERASELYAQAITAEAVEHERIAQLARAVVAAATPRAATVLVWAANPLAARLGRALTSQGLDAALLVDNARQKIGRSYPGFAQPVIPPVFDHIAGRALLFLLCSAAWNDQIRQQVASLQLPQTVVVDAVSWRPDVAIP